MSEAFTESATSALTTKGDIFTFSTAPARLAIGSDTQKLIADSAQATGLGWADDIQWIVKAGDQTFSDSTLANVTSMVFVLAASTSYILEAFLLLSSNNTDADYKFGWTAPVDATMFWGPGSVSTAAGHDAVYWHGAGLTSATNDALIAVGGTVGIGAINGTTAVTLKAIVRNLTNAGNLQLQAAQNATQVGTTTQVLKDSNMWIRKLQ